MMNVQKARRSRALYQMTRKLSGQDDLIITAFSQDDLGMIIHALSAYQHNSDYLALYERLRRLRTDSLSKRRPKVEKPEGQS